MRAMKNSDSEMDYDEMVKALANEPPRTWVVCRSIEEAQALAAWIEEFEAE